MSKSNNPSYYQTAGPVTSLVQHQEHSFHLYAHQRYGDNEHTTVPPLPRLGNKFGCTEVYDLELRDGRDETKANIVGRLQGVATAAGKSSENWYTSANMIFTDERFNGSTMNVQGRSGHMATHDRGDWAVMGGTGQFACAQGVVSYERIWVDKNICVTELRIRAVCLTFPRPAVVQRLGPWGGNGGASYKIPSEKLPKRLRSITVTVSVDKVLQSIEFSYIDQVGQKRTFGPWGTTGNGTVQQATTIRLATSETVKKMYVSTGNYGERTVVTSLTFVTSTEKPPYGPYGKKFRGDNSFRVAAPTNHSIVGFFGRAAAGVVHQIGAYVAPN